MSVFTSSTTFTVPKGVKEIEVFAVGGGGNGGSCGGGGGYTITNILKVNSGSIINVSIGTAAANTIINDIVANGALGANGGSGGGGDMGDSIIGGRGGSDGSDGYRGSGSNYGTGQGTTTRAFEEPEGTLYAGGGGGYGHRSVWGPDYNLHVDGGGGSGGAGGGGNGGSSSNWSSYEGKAASGAANTGGGGGGGYNGALAGKGGSGIAIIRWGY